MSNKSASQRANDAVRRKAEIAAGIRQDRRFVGKVIPNKRRKKSDKQQTREMREEDS